MGGGGVRIFFRVLFRFSNCYVELKGDRIEYRLDNKDISDINVDEAGIAINSNSVQEFLTITDFDNKPDNISYPIGEGKERASFLWFVGNKRINPENKENNFSMRQETIYKVLPKINDKDNTLPKYEEITRGM